MLWCEVLDELMVMIIIMMIIMLAWGGMGNICCISGGLKGISFQLSAFSLEREADGGLSCPCCLL